ncbi:hypothetical protein EMCG_01368 [[Emmonsia] crescens]|uniref:Uncharacterized protein n=1 Tax=[Emmonsia] crescens TaxID=73230 RepID=A0A0G2I393_9EURO|nr:hypothetical protein EMCG_01368 [Emmonsia crescens UAMH 3008]
MFFLSIFILSAVFTGPVFIRPPSTELSRQGLLESPGASPKSPGMLTTRQTRNKLSLVGLVALLAAASTATPLASPIEESIDATAAGWTCKRDGWGGSSTLIATHSAFNRKFGNSRLTMAGHQCYVVKCYQHYFGICNYTSYVRVEKSGVRNDAKNAIPYNRGSACIFNGGWGATYVFGNEEHLVQKKGDHVRIC